MRRAGERGEGKLKLILWLLLLAAIVYTGFKTVPHYVNNYELEQFMQDEVRFAVAQRKTEEEVRNVIYAKITDLGIPASRENIVVHTTTRGASITVNYTVEVDLLGYKLRLNFHPSADSRAL